MGHEPACLPADEAAQVCGESEFAVGLRASGVEWHGGRLADAFAAARGCRIGVGASPTAPHGNYWTRADEERVDSGFGFLDADQAELLSAIFTRRCSDLIERIRQSDNISRSNADAVMSVLGEELVDNLNVDRGPTEYGRSVDAVLAVDLGGKLS
ncbi:hypothetical protein ACN27E_13405 [Mycobacterium sp. WMMD1722]|uniref:hypothetical protein n=1 Tax=Mycobacterium sp. WMMD1722 TaxID=3404117 RepID=UPI003BF4EF76